MLSEKKAILVIQTAFIGDVFLAVPMLKELRKLYPKDELYVVVREGLAEFLKKFNLADEVFEIKKGNRESYLSIQSQLQIHQFRYIISPHSSFRTGLLTMSLKAEKKISYLQWWNKFFFDIRIIKNDSWPEPMRQMQLLEPLWQEKLLDHFGMSKELDYRKMITPVVEDLKMSLNPEVWLPHLEVVKNLLFKYSLEPKKFIVIFPSSVWKTKQWTVEGFTHLAKQLESQKYDIVLMGSKAEYELCETITHQLSRKINLAGSCTLWESLLVLSAAKLVVCNDSGSMHMGAFVEVPTVAIFGPTVLEQGFRPWQNHAIVVENNKINCRPCGKHGHKACPLKHHNCMKTISSDLVFSACKSYI